MDCDENYETEDKESHQNMKVYNSEISEVENKLFSKSDKQEPKSQKAILGVLL